MFRGIQLYDFITKTKHKDRNDKNYSAYCGDGDDIKDNNINAQKNNNNNCNIDNCYYQSSSQSWLSER